MARSSPTADQRLNNPQIKGAMDLEADRDALDFSVEKSMRYHARRQAHYEWLHRSMMFLVILSGSAAFGDLFESPQLLGFAAALFGAWDLVWSFSTKARDHYFLRSRFCELANEVRGTPPTQDTMAAWWRKRVDIEKDEGPVYWAVEKDCFNEVSAAWGRPDRYTLNGFEYWLMNWIRFERLERAANSRTSSGSPDALAPHPPRS